MSLRVCAEPRCPTLVERGARDGRCDEHRRAKDRARGTRQERGYDAAHVAEREHWAPIVATGTVTCRRAPFGLCLADNPTIAPDEPWDLGHPDAECPAAKAPEHRGCNRATSGR